MDTVTHILAGTAMGYAAAPRYGKAGAAAIVAASAAPDLDNVLNAFGNVTYLEYHRVISNSLPGMVVLSLFCALVARRFWKDGGSLRTLWALAFVSVFVHVSFDLMNSYGAKPFWPLQDGWYALDSVFIVDPWITGPIILAVVLMAKGRNRAMVFLALVEFLALYVGARIALHGVAVERVSAGNPDAVSVGAFPSPLNPFKWRVVVEREERYTAGWYDVLDGSLSGVETLVKPEETAPIRAAREARAARVFLDFARFPLARVEEVPGGWNVSFTDLRFSFNPGDRRFVASVRVNEDMTHGPGEFRFGSDR